MIKRLCDNSAGGPLDTPLAPHLDAYTDFLTERRYAAHTVQFYLAGIAHFSRWASGCQLDIQQIDEEVTRRFLDDHLPHCGCPNTVHRVRKDLRAALSHLLVVLRARGVIAEPFVAMTPTDEELRRFNTTASFPIGLYWQLQRSAGKGDLVLFCPPVESVFLTALERGYLSPGFCSAGSSPLLKRVVAVGGDHVVITPTDLPPTNSYKALMVRENKVRISVVVGM